MDCRVRIAQIDTTLGNWMANVESHAEWIRAAIEDGIDLIVFPELSLTGYFLKDQTSEVALTREAPEFQAAARVFAPDLDRRRLRRAGARRARVQLDRVPRGR